MLDQGSLNLISDILKIDPRILLEGAKGGDVLGKEYMSISDSKRLQGEFNGYEIAPTARSARSPDLKGSFINVVGDEGGTLQLQHNVHYLVTSGELLITYWEKDPKRCHNQKLEYFDGLWIPPGVSHCFQGFGSLIALTNGEILVI